MRRLMFLGLALVAIASTTRGDTWYGGIEIGPGGVKMVAIPIDDKGRPIALKIIEDERPVDLGQFREAEMRQVAAVVEAFHTRLAERGVSPKRLWIVAGSDLDLGKGQANYDLLAKAVKKATGDDEELIRLNRDDEFNQMIRGAVPSTEINYSVLIHLDAHARPRVGSVVPQVGRGLADQQLLTSEVDSPSAFADKVRATMGMRTLAGPKHFAAVATELRASCVKSIQDGFERKAAIINGKHVYVSGDVAQAIVTLREPLAAVTGQNLYVPLTAKMLREARNAFSDLKPISPPDMQGYPSSIVAKIGKQVEEVRRKFTPESLLAGTEVLLAFAEALEWEERDKVVKYTKPGVAAWVLGYVEGERKP